MTDRERAKLPIYEAKITKAERLRPRNDKGIIICSLPLIGIPVAQSFWPGEDSLSVILTPEELSQWYNIYKHPEDVSQWWINYWWKIEDPPDPNSILNRDRDLKVPAGESPWLVHSGLCWGPLAGGSTTELWSWDGKEARFVRIFHSLVF